MNFIIKNINKKVITPKNIISKKNLIKEGVNFSGLNKNKGLKINNFKLKINKNNKKLNNNNIKKNNVHSHPETRTEVIGNSRFTGYVMVPVTLYFGYDILQTELRHFRHTTHMIKRGPPPSYMTGPPVQGMPFQDPKKSLFSPGAHFSKDEGKTFRVFELGDHPFFDKYEKLNEKMKDAEWRKKLPILFLEKEKQDALLEELKGTNYEADVEALLDDVPNTF